MPTVALEGDLPEKLSENLEKELKSKADKPLTKQ